MTIKKTAIFTESDIRKIVTDHIKSSGYTVIGELTINTTSKADIPKGAIPFNVVSIVADIEEQPEPEKQDL